MQLEHIEAIEKRLWSAADTLRANSNYASNEYFLPVMGLIFLRHAYSRYLRVKANVEANLPTRGGKARALSKEDFSQQSAIFLQPKAQFAFPERCGRTIVVAGSLSLALAGQAAHATQAELPTPRYAAAVVEVHGRVYVIGGVDEANNAVTTVELYDPAEDSWKSGAAMPTARGVLGCSAVDGKIYLVGGTLNGPDKFATVEAYDPERDQWRRVADLSTARNALSAATVAGRIYALGGWGIDPNGRAKDFATVETYDPVTDQWSTAAAMPTARSHMTTLVVNDRIYTVGGWMMRAGRETALAQVEVYDPETDSWDRVADLPTARWLAASAVIDGRIYVLGGWAVTPDGRRIATSTVEVFDPASGEWARDTDMATPRAGHAAVAAGVDEILVLGGTSSGSPRSGARSLVAQLEDYRPSHPAEQIRITASATRDPAFGQPASVAEFRDGGAYGTLLEVQPPFGNLTTSFVESDLQRLGLAIGDQFQVQIGDSSIEVVLGKDFSDVARGKWVALLMPAGTLSLAMNFSNAAQACACQPGTTIFIAGVVR